MRCWSSLGENQIYSFSRQFEHLAMVELVSQGVLFFPQNENVLFIVFDWFQLCDPWACSDPFQLTTCGKLSHSSYLSTVHKQSVVFPCHTWNNSVDFCYDQAFILFLSECESWSVLWYSDIIAKPTVSIINSHLNNKETSDQVAPPL